MTGDDKLHRITNAAADRAVAQAEDAPGRRGAWVAAAVLVVCLALGAWYFASRIGDLQDQADANAAVAAVLADQVEDLGAEPVVDPPPVNDPDPNDPEAQDEEIQNPEIQEAERQNPEVQDPERADAERDDPDPNDPDPDDPEVQDAEIQDPEVDDPPIPGPRGEQGPPGPTCPPGYTAQDREHDPTPLRPGDEETWWVCVENGDT